MPSHAAEILAAFPNYSALVVGDICLDRWCTYDPATAEPSHETGISRIGVVSTEVAPGAGGNVANNLASLGVGRAAVLGVLGDDGFAHELTRSLNQRGISTDLLVRSEKLPTFTYTKLINGNTGVEDLPRVDFINTQPLPDIAEQEVLEYLRAFAPTFDIIFVSDQADTRRGGVMTAAVRMPAMIAGAANGKRTLVSSCVGVMPSADAASTASGSAWRTPLYVPRTIG